MAKSLFKPIVNAAYYTAIFRVVNQSVTLLITLVLVRGLSEHEYGIYNLLYATIPLLSTFISFGFETILQRYIPEFLRHDKKGESKNLYRLFGIIRFTLSSVLLLLTFLAWENVSGYFGLGSYKFEYGIFILCILSYQQWQLTLAVMESGFKHKKIQAGILLYSLVRLIAYLVLFNFPDMLLGVIIIDSIYHFLLFIKNHSVIHKQIFKDIQPKRLEAEDRRRITKFSILANINNVGVQLMDRGIDLYILAFYLSPVAVGIYAFSYRFTRIIMQFNPVSYMFTVLRPAYFSIGASGNRDNLKFMNYLFVKYSTLVYIPVILFMAINGEYLINLLFGKYEEYLYIVISIMIFSSLNEFARAVGLSAQLHERMDILIYSKLAGILKVAACLVVIPLWGIMGAVVASGIALLLKNIFVFWFVREDFEMGRISKAVMYISAYWLLIYSGLYLAGMTHSMNGSQTFISFLIFSAGFVLFIINMPMQRKEKDLLKKASGENRFLSVLVHIGRSR